MLQLFPFLAWLAPATSITMIGMLIAAGNLRARPAIVVCLWCAAAAWWQFFGGSPGASVTGLGLQTLLAVALIVRWRLIV
jgi:hypothetical protein